MGLSNAPIMENFNEKNIEGIRSIIEQERINGPRIERAYTMVQENSPCDVIVTEASRKICVDALLK